MPAAEKLKRVVLFVSYVLVEDKYFVHIRYADVTWRINVGFRDCDAAESLLASILKALIAVGFVEKLEGGVAVEI